MLTGCIVNGSRVVAAADGDDDDGGDDERGITTRNVLTPSYSRRHYALKGDNFMMLS